MDQVEFSVVIPVHNSEESLPLLIEKLHGTFSKMSRAYEIILINDCSSDNSYNVLKKIKSDSDHVIIIDLFRNYGQANALMCGFNYCSGNYIITMDDDLQQNPEDIPLLYNKILEGYDVVIGSYPIKQHSLIKNIGSRMIRSLNRHIFRINNKELKFTSFRIVKKEVINQIKSERTVYPYISGMLVSTTNNIANVDVQHNKRLLGESSYNVSKMIRLSFNLIVNYSSLPLKFFGYLGLIVSLFSLIFASIVLFKKMLLGNAPPGWTTLIVLVSFYNSLNFIFLFLLGEYVSRILKEVSNKKQYVIREVIR